MGLSATFSVSADVWGSPTPVFQWAKNGVPIDGATNATYTTPPTTFADNGSNFTVTVSNGISSIATAPATLTVTGRAPVSGDLRFQQVDAADTVNGGEGGVFTDFSNELSLSAQNSYGTPMWLGPGVCQAPPPGINSVPCVWNFAINDPSGATTPNANYQAFTFANLQSELTTLNVPSVVVTSLDLEPDDGVFGLVWMQSNQGGGFDMTQHTVSLRDLQTAANQEGASGRVVTAISFNAGQVFYLSYGWQSDASTVYETHVATSASIDDAPALASNLAAQGYIVTAMGMGSNGANGVVLIGTRVQGDTVARPFTTNANECFQGYAVVGLVAEDAANPSAGYLCER
jgi:hypothetical protein